MPYTDADTFGMANRFKVVVVPGDYDLGSWAKAEGLEVSFEMPEYRAGDAWNNRWMYPSFTKYPTVKLTRAAVKKDTPNVKKWLDDTATKFAPGSIKVTLLDAKGTEVHAWECKHAIPQKWSISGGFDASASKVITETLEFNHVGFLDDEKAS
jgi:phage tail-like protein